MAQNIQRHSKREKGNIVSKHWIKAGPNPAGQTPNLVAVCPVLKGLDGSSDLPFLSV